MKHNFSFFTISFFFDVEKKFRELEKNLKFPSEIFLEKKLIEKFLVFLKTKKATIDSPDDRTKLKFKKKFRKFVSQLKQKFLCFSESLSLPLINLITSMNVLTFLTHLTDYCDSPWLESLIFQKESIETVA